MSTYQYGIGQRGLGGVGTLLVQFARQAGARMVALAGQPGKLAIAGELGADVAVNYREDGWAEQVRAAAGQVGVVFDGVGGEIAAAAFGLLAAGGRFCPFGMASGSFAPVSAELAQAHQVSVRRGTPLSEEETLELVQTVLAEAAAGSIRPVVGQEFRLGEAAAHAAIEAGASAGDLTSIPVRNLFALKTVTGFSLLAWRAACAEQARADVAELTGLLETGRLRAAAETVLPLAEVAQAHRLLEERVVLGRLLLVP